MMNGFIAVLAGLILLGVGIYGLHNPDSVGKESSLACWISVFAGGILYTHGLFELVVVFNQS